jgi:hypothetical protein
VEHGVDLNAERKQSRRPDPSSFMSMFSQIRDEDSSRPHNNPHATATPVAVRDVILLAMDGYQQIATASINDGHEEFLHQLVETLANQAESAKIQGVSQEFIDALERVPKIKLKKTDMCPICAELFLNDEHPLVVRLPCHPSHKFDLECIAPWLKLQGTCPLDRKELDKKKKVGPVVPLEDDEYCNEVLAEHGLYM